MEGYEEEHLDADESGIFTWNLETNILQGDTMLARLFGLEVSDVLSGLPISDYLDRITPEDRPKVSQSIHHSILTGDPYHSVYSVSGTEGICNVMAFGRCFRDALGNPSQYAGIVFRMTDGPPDADAMLSHIAMAHKLAAEAGREQVADALEAILEDLSRSRPRSMTH